MNRPSLFSITTRLMLLALAPLIIIEIIFAWYHTNDSRDSARKALTENGHLISEQLAEASTFYLLAGDYDSISLLISKSFNRPYVAFISVHNKSGVSIAQHSNINFRPEDTKQYLHFEKVVYNDQIYSPDLFELEDDTTLKQDIGLLHLYLSKKSIDQKANSTLKKTIIYSSLVFLLAFFFIFMFTKKITAPFYGLLQHIKNAEKGNLGEKIEDIEPNEIGILQLGFNNMTQSLLNSRQQLDMDVKNATLKLMDLVSELESKNTELESSKNEALKADKIKSSFLANMSHEIRTPINGIKGFIGLLSKSQLNDEQERYTKIIEQSSSDLITIVNEILDFSKIESGKLSLQSLSFDFIDCIETIRDQFFPAALDKDIDIFLSIYSDVPRYVIGDQIRLKQILINLIGNAIKFTEKGYVQIKVFLSDIDTEGFSNPIQIDIKDTGIGINEKDKSQLFNAFQQIESETNRRYSGTGLGLVISRKLARLMKGDISLKSKKTEGSTFSLTLPITEDPKAEPPTDDSLSEELFFLISSNNKCLSEVQSLFTRADLMTETLLISTDAECENALKSILLSLQHIQYLVIDHRELAEPYRVRFIYEFSGKCKIINLDYKQTTDYEHCFFISSTTHSSKLINTIINAQKETVTKIIATPLLSNSKRILVVDDNKINLTFAFELLSQWGHKPTQANSALEALELYLAQPFDLVLMDIQMPEYDGIDGMKMLKKAPTNKHAQIIALTANALPEEETRLRKLGFNGYISKPIDEEALLAIINNDAIPLIKKKSSHLELTSINYKNTLKLSGDNKELVKQVFQMLLKEIPQYQKSFECAKRESDITLFKSTKHKLEGTTCYASLPKLKSILINAVQMDSFDNDITDRLLNELEVLRKTLRSF